MPNIKTYLSVVIFLTIQGFASAQKAAEVSASLEFNSFLASFESGDVNKAKASLTNAKNQIDQAAIHVDTKNSPKTLYLVGEIYYYATTLFSDAFPDVNKNIDKSVKAWQTAYTLSDNFDDKIKESIRKKQNDWDLKALQHYNNKLFRDAEHAYSMRAALSSAIGQIDTTSLYFAGVCAEQANEFKSAASYYAKCADYKYKVPEIYKSTANALIQDGQYAAAIEYLSKSVALNTQDKVSYYALGSLYMELGQNESATENLKRAIAIDKQYWDAQYQLGAHLQALGVKKKSEADKIGSGTTYEKLIAEANEFFKQAIVPLEAYISGNPNDRAVLKSLYQLYSAIGNTKKSEEYKAKL